MKEINLREYYPFYTQDVIVEVPDEVAALLHELKLAEAASFLRTYRHKAYFFSGLRCQCGARCTGGGSDTG